MANQSAQIDLAVTVNALVDKITVQENQLKKAISTLEENFKKQKIDLKAPTTITPQLETDLTAFKKEVAKIKTALTKELKSATQLKDVSLGIADAIKKELQDANSKIIPQEGKKVITGLKSFLDDLLKENTTLTKGQKKNLISGLLTIEGATLSSAKRTINDFQKDVVAASDQALAKVGRIQQLLAQQPGQVKALRSELAGGVPSGIAAAKKDAEALVDLYNLLRKSSGKMELTGTTSKDIENLQLRISLIRKSMDDLARLNAEMARNPSRSVDFGFTPQQGLEKMDAFRKALAQTRDTLAEIKKEASGIADVEKATKKAAETQAVADAARAQGAQGYIKLLREQYTAQLALDKKSKDFGASDAILVQLNQELEIRKRLDDVTKRQRTGIDKYQEALFGVANAAKIDLDTELKARNQLLSVMEKQAISSLKFSADELKAERDIIANIKQEIAERNSLANLQKQSAENVALMKAKNLTVQEQVTILKDQLAVQTKLQALTGKESEQIPLLQRMIAAREKVVDRLNAEEALRAKVEKSMIDASNAEVISTEKALAAYKRLQEVLIAGGNITKQLYQAEEAYVANRIRDLEHEIALSKQLAAEQTQLANIQKSFGKFTTGAQALSSGGLNLTQYKEASNQIDQFKSKLVELEKLATSADAQIASAAQQMIDVYKRESSAIETLLINEKQLVEIRTASSRAATAQTDENRIKALQQQARAVQELITALHDQGKAGTAVAANMRDFHAQLTQQIAATKLQIAETRSLESSYTKLGNAFRSFVRYGLEYAAFYKIQQAITDVVKGVVQLEDAFKSVQAVAGATSAEMESVIAAIKKVAIETEFSTNQIAEAAQTLAQAGLAIKDVGAALDATAKFASATGTSLKTSADLMTTMKNVFQDMRFDQIADQLTSTINLSKLSGEGLATILSRAVEVSDSFKIIPEQMQAAFAVLKNAGIKDSTISTGYRQALLELFAPDEKLLKYLQGRYAEMGRNLSKETIAAMFQSFTQEKSPILAVLTELDKLGFATTHAAEAARVFDVRAKNVIDVLIKQKEEFASLTTQIGAHGTAAQGARTQLESLGKSWDNLGSVISVIATDRMGGMMKSLEGIVDLMTDLIQKSGEASNALVKIQGSSGAASAAITGVLTGLGTFFKTGSGLKGVLAGATAGGLAGQLENIVTSYVKKFGDDVTRGVSTTMEVVSTFFAGKFLWDSLKKRLAVDLAAGVASYLPPQGKLIAMAVAAVGATYLALRGSVTERIKAIQNDLEKSKAELDQSKSKLGERKQDKEAYDNLIIATDKANRALQDLLASNTSGVDNLAGIANKAAEDLRGKSLDLSGTEFQDAIARLEQETGGLAKTFDPSAYADSIRRVNEVVSQWDGERLKYFDQISRAYETSEKDRTEDQKRVLAAFEGMSISQKGMLLKEIKNLDDVKAFTDKKDGFVSQFYNEVLKPVGDTSEKYLQQQREEAKALIEKAIEEDNFGELYSKVLSSFKEGNISLLNMLEKQINEELLRAESNLAIRRERILKQNEGDPAKAQEALRKDKRTQELQGILDQRLSVKDFLSESQSKAASAAVDKAIKSLEDMASKYAETRDTFVASLSQQELQRLGIAQNAVKQHLEDVNAVVKDLPDEWKGVFKTVVAQGMKARDIVNYLESEKNARGDMPQAVQDLLDKTKEQAAAEEKNNEFVNERQAKLKEIVDSAEGFKQRALKMAAQEEEIRAQLENENLSVKDRLVLYGKLALISANRINLARDIEKQEERGSAIQTEINNATGVQQRIVEERNTKLKEFFKEQDQNARASAKSIKALEDTRANLLESGNAQAVLTGTLEKDIYNKKVSEEARRQEDVKGQLMMNKEFREKFAQYKDSIADFADFLKSPEGQAWMAEQKDIAPLLKDLGTSVDKARGAFDDMAANLEKDYSVLSAEMQKRLSTSTKMTEIGQAQSVQGAVLNNKLVNDTANLEKTLTEITIAGIKDREQAQQEYTNTLAAARDQIYAAEVKAVQDSVDSEADKTKKLTAINKTYYDGKLSLLTSELDSRKQNLDALYAAEKKHADRVRQLDQELRQVRIADRDFLNSILRANLQDNEQFWFDQNVAATKFYEAKALLVKKDYVNGKDAIDSAISAQQAYVQEVDAAERAGQVAYGTTYNALLDLSVMQKERTDAIQRQRYIEEKARLEAEKAVADQLKATQDLVQAINLLNVNITKTPKMDLGLDAQIDKAKALEEAIASAEAAANAAKAAKGPSTGELAGTMKMTTGGAGDAGATGGFGASGDIGVTTGANGEQSYFSKSLAAQKEYYNSLKLTNEELAKHGNEIVKVVDAQGKVTYTTGAAASAMDLEGSKVKILNEATAEAGITHNNLQKSMDGTSKSADGVASSITAIPSDKQINVDANTEQAQTNVDGVKGSVENIPTTVTTTVDANTEQAQTNVDGVKGSVENIPTTVTTTVDANVADAQTKVGEIDKTTTDLDNKQTKPVIEADGKPAVEELNSVLNFFTQVFQNLNASQIKLTADASGVFTVLRQIDEAIAVPRTMTIYVKKRPAGSGADGGDTGGDTGGDIGGGGYSTGGLIKGRGTGTSDSIPAMLSNGEYVIPADVVKKVGLPYLEQLRNGGMQTFAKGGYASTKRLSTEDEIASQILNNNYRGSLSDPAFLEYMKNSPKGSLIATSEPDRVIGQASAQGGKASYVVSGKLDYEQAVRLMNGLPPKFLNGHGAYTLAKKMMLLRIFSKEEITKLQEAQAKVVEEKKAATQKAEAPTPAPAPAPAAEPVKAAEDPWKQVQSSLGGQFQISDSMKSELMSTAERFMRGEFTPQERDLKVRFAGKSLPQILEYLAYESRMKSYKDAMSKAPPMAAGGLASANAAFNPKPVVGGISNLTQSVNSTTSQPSVQSAGIHQVLIRSDVGRSANLQGTSQQVDDLLGVLKSLKGVTIQ
jgi:hypothetical protein